MTSEYTNLETKLIHAGEPSPLIEGAVSMPIFQSSTFEYGRDAAGEELRYIRLSNTPNHIVLHKKLAVLENAEAALVTASGMAAISATILAMLSAGDHLLVQEGIYGGTLKFIAKDFSTLGLSHDFIQGNDPTDWKKKLKPNTKAIYVETIANPLMQVAAHEEVVVFAREHDLVSIIDNTFASPINFRPPEWGFDVSLHSCTKYLNGHSDIIAGAVIGTQDFVEKISQKLTRLGGALDPHACYLLHRGMKTLALRVRYQNESTHKIAQFLENHPAVTNVNYPGLESHPQHAQARKLLDGYSGMLSFVLEGGAEAAKAFLERVTIPIVAPSLGGIETLITRPVMTSHRGVDKEELDRLGISPGLIRLSVGIESTEDLIQDLTRALSSVS